MLQRSWRRPAADRQHASSELVIDDGELLELDKHRHHAGNGPQCNHADEDGIGGCYKRAKKSHNNLIKWK